MRCPECRTDDAIHANVVIKLRAPLTKGGGLKLVGALTQEEVRRQWHAQDKNCVCVHCGAAYVYVDGDGLTS